MIYTVNYTKKNSFMRYKNEPRLVQKNADGEITNESRYVKPGVSKALKIYVPQIHYRKNTMQVALSQKDLDDLVKKMELYDDDNNIITSAPLRNPSAPFWRHPSLRIQLETSGTTLDDDHPMDKFWLACFEADPRFRFAGEDVAPSVASRVQFTITKATEKFDEKTEKLDESYEAQKALIKMEDDVEKMTKILRAMGTSVKTTNHNLIRQALQRKITEYKDNFVKGTSERNIEMFLRLAKGNSADLEMRAIVNQAQGVGIIGKQANGKYVYGDIVLGTSISGVESFLRDDNNTDILNEIIVSLKEDGTSESVTDSV